MTSDSAMASHATFILAILLTLAFRNAESRSIAIVKGKTDNERKLFSNASTIHVKPGEVDAIVKPRNISIITLTDARKEEEEVRKEDLSDPISGVVIESAIKTVRLRHEKEGDVEEDSGDVSEDERDVKFGKILWIVHHCSSNHGRRSECDNDESNNGHSSPKRNFAFYEDEEEVDVNDKEVENDVDFDDIEVDEDDTQSVDEDQKDMEDLEGTVVKDNNSSDNVNDNDENKRGNDNEDADDGDNGEEAYK